MILFLDSISYPSIVILCIETQGRNKLICFAGSPSLHRHSDKGNLTPMNKRFSMMQSFLEIEERLKEFTADLQKMKEEYAGTMANGDLFKGQQTADSSLMT